VRTELATCPTNSILDLIGSVNRYFYLSLYGGEMEEWQEVLRRLLLQEMADKGLSQRELGRELGVSHVQIGRWMRGEDIPSAESQIKLARLFGLPETPFSQLMRGRIGERQLLVEQITEYLRPLSGHELEAVRDVLEAMIRAFGVGSRPDSEDA